MSQKWQTAGGKVVESEAEVKAPSRARKPTIAISSSATHKYSHRQGERQTGDKDTNSGK